MDSFNRIYKGLKVLVTGHTGFKGSWLSIWLKELGAHVVGYSLAPPTEPSHFALTGLDQKMISVIGDVRDYTHLEQVIADHEPTIIFHLAAQPIVLHSYMHPKETFDVNSGGTVNLLEAVRQHPSPKAVVVVTTDKCYENQEWAWGYRENDRLGGKDPYSASKSMSELATESYRLSFFSKEGSPAVATARAGNVIGGGDFSEFRILPDSMKALIHHHPIPIRNPQSVRPWLNVMDPLAGYLQLGAKLLTDKHGYAEAWNFGPKEQQGISVSSIVDHAIESWGAGDWIHTGNPDHQSKEMGLLRLNWDKAAHRLNWRPVYDWKEAVQDTVEWYKAYKDYINKGDVDLYEVAVNHLLKYTYRASHHDLSWATQHRQLITG